MNHHGVVREVSAISGVEPATCDVVLTALQKVLQKELSGSKGLGVLTKIQSLLKTLNKSDD